MFPVQYSGVPRNVIYRIILCQCSLGQAFCFPLKHVVPGEEKRGRGDFVEKIPGEKTPRGVLSNISVLDTSATDSSDVARFPAAAYLVHNTASDFGSQQHL